MKADTSSQISMLARPLIVTQIKVAEESFSILSTVS